jgi:hypothetical protein
MTAPRPAAEAYERDREAAGVRSLDRSRAGRDIAAGYPPPGNLERRAACERDLRRFFETYFPVAFRLAWSDDHLRVIDRIQKAVLEGGLFALAMPRGRGKTTKCERCALWALLYGHRRFVALIGATDSAAAVILDHLKTELQWNDLLAEDFRQVCYPIRRLENNGRKAGGQLFQGEQTRITWGKKRLTLPVMPDGACDGPNVSGSVVTIAGLTGALRGQSHVLPSGEIIRPELVLLDDPQTRESATSVTQCAERLAIISGDVLGMAGPGKQITAIMPCTVVREGDVADTLLNRELYPQWQGERTRAVYAWPADDALWDQYLKLRAEGQRRGEGTRAATEFYQQHRQEMDAGARIAWPALFNADELSAVQNVVNLRANLGEEAFAAEYQNEPLKPDAGHILALTARQVAAKVNGIKRGVCPVATEHVTAFVDVHDNLLFWCVCAWKGDFSGWVIDYGSFPKQHRRQFTLRKAPRTLETAFPGAGREAAILAGLGALAGDILAREWPREDGARLKVGRCLVDAGYVPDVVYDFCRHSSHAAILSPSRGLGIGAGKAPMSDWPEKPGERRGWFWNLGRSATRVGRLARFDANHWKAFVHTRLGIHLGDPTSLSLYGSDEHEHLTFSEHAAAESCKLVSADGRQVWEWSMRPGVADNHWLDCLTGCAVGASMLGCALPAVGQAKPTKRKLTTWAEMQARAKERRQQRKAS